MAEDIHEAVVRLKPEGAEETQTALEDATGQFEESTNEMQEQTEIMDRFSKKFKGAMAVAIAGLTVAAAGLASKVPVLGEAFAGLNAILTAIGYQIDSVLRPILAPVSDWFFEIAGAINDAEGPMGTFIGVIGTLVLVLGGLAAAAATVGGAMGGVSGALGAVKTLLLFLGGLIKSFVVWLAGIVSGSTAAAAALGVLIGTLGVGIMEVTGVNDAIQNLGKTIANGLPKWANTGLVAFLSIFTGILATIGAAVLGFVEGTLEGGLEEGLRQSVARVKEILNIFLWAWKDVLNRAGDFAGNLLDEIRSVVNEAFELINQLPYVDIGSPVSGGGSGGSGGVTQLQGSGLPGDASSGGKETVAPSASGGGGTTTEVYLDGRQVSNATSQYRDDSTNRRGVF